MTTEAIAPLRAAIKQHLESHGARDWKLVRGNFPEISESDGDRTILMLYACAKRSPATVAVRVAIPRADNNGSIR
jgi:hypothetical protein